MKQSRPLRLTLAGLLTVLALLPLIPRESLAAAGAWAENDQAAVRLLAAGAATGDGRQVALGLHFRLSPGWKIYWRSPGDAGYPPSVDWTGSQNLAGTTKSWPVPHRFSLFGLETFGYAEEVVFPITAQLADPAGALDLQARVSYLVCEEICIPHEAEIALALPAGPATPAPENFLIETFREQVPDDGARDGLSLESALLTGDLKAPVLEVVARSTTPFDSPDLLVEGPPEFSFAKPELQLLDGNRTAVLRTAVGNSAEGVIEGKRLTLTVTDGLRGMETEQTARFGAVPSASMAFDFSALLPILALAFLGGLILNLMPCVLPVLSIKLLSVVEHGGRARGEVRAGFLASAAGIVASFMVLAAGAVALKSAGASVGWGIQFQQPLFLSAIALIVTLFAYNLMGLFEINLPAWLNDRLGAPAPQQTNGAKGGARGLLGHFGTGAFATLLATPCSAPFLGTAVSFALARGPLEIFSIFAMLGAGLAAPFLAVALFPALAGRLPKPGAWMVTLRRALGVALLLTAVWLVTVLASQIGMTGAIVAALLLAVLGLVIRLGRDAKDPRRRAAAATAVTLSLAVFALPAGFAETPKQRVLADAWVQLDEQRIADLVGGGQVVFVDITADWCITCQVNKTLVIERQEVQDLLARDTMVAMRGDWTLPDEAITRYLAGFDRYGIPFNAVYGPAAPDGIPLPELLTVEAVLEAVEKAEGASPRLASDDRRQ